jgi:hypothetical protein
MGADGELDPEGWVLREVRALAGAQVPIVMSLDLHGILTDRMLRQVDGLTIYHTYPHVDFADTGARAAKLLLKLMAGGVKPTIARVTIPALVRGVKEIASRHGLTTICYGHAGDGNLHVNILKMDLSDEIWNARLPDAIEEIFRLTVALGGTLSGEHGIGYSQKRYMPIAFKPHELRLMKSVKAAFDPRGLLNPGKMIPEGT